MKNLLKNLLFSICLLAVVSVGSTVMASGEKAPNVLTIESVVKEGQPLTGFIYNIYSEDGTHIVADLTKTSIFKVELPNGTYTIKEVKRLDGYEPAKDIKVDLPLIDGNVEYNSINIRPKHIESKFIQEPDKNTPNKDIPKKDIPEKSIKTPINPDTGDKGIAIFVIAGVTAISLLVLTSKKRKEANK